MAKAAHTHGELEHGHRAGLGLARGVPESGHAHGESPPTPAAARGSVALDIGAGRGALVLYPGERFRGLEIEISRFGSDARRVHTGVHERTTEARSLLTAVFGSLPAGEYVVWEDAVTAGPVVTVPDGAVAEVTLR